MNDAWGEDPFGKGLPDLDPDQPDLDRVRLLYQELRRIARRERRIIPSATLNTTALVHEVWLRLAAGENEFRDRRHFLAVAAVAMRRMVVDYARYRLANKRGGDAVQVELGDDDAATVTDIDRILDIDQAMEELEALDPRLCRLVELRFFTGLSNEDAAEVLEVSPRTAARDWKRARALLASNLQDGPAGA
jgi:RNA polymerase sigma factor (TIGR02999 family)